MSGSVMIGLHGVTKNFAHTQVIREFSLDIYQGEFVTLLGASGSGKTTILRMIAGFEEVSGGRVTIDGVDMTGLPANLRPVNSVFQNYALFPHLNVYDNVAFGLRIKKFPEKLIKERVRESLNMVGLDAFATRRIRQLSGGQQQRVAIARAIINRPKVLLLDEPLSALDLKLRKEMQLELKRLHRELGITFVYVTHDQEEAMSMSDRIGVLAHGELLQYASPEELYANPASAAVASFVGETNLFDGTVVDIVKGYSVIQTRHFLTKAPVAEGHAVGSAVVLSVRPEAIRLGDSVGAPICRGIIMERIFAGSLIRIWVRVDEALTIQCLIHGTRNDEFPIGEEVDVIWEPNHSLAFPKEIKSLSEDSQLLGSNESAGQ